MDDPISSGRTADIHPWKEGWVLKLFHTWFSEQGVEYEARIGRAVHAAGLPVPAVGEIVRVDGRVGLEYERIDGISMWVELAARPWRLVKLSRMLAELHVDLHALEGIEGVPVQRQRLREKILGAEGLSSELQEASLRALDEMPGGRALCHGDFHPANVMLAPKGPVVIDWIDATVGNPLADVARTTVLAGGVVAAADMRALERVMVRWLHRVYLKRYFQLRPGGEEEYKRWQPIVAAARMDEGIEELEDWLRGQVEAGLG